MSDPRITPGELSAAQARAINDALLAVERLKKLAVAPPLSLTRPGGIPNISLVNTTTTTTSTTTTTTTTTTAGPCTGSCTWTYTFATQLWSLTSSTCPTGCHCLAPTYCPAANGSCTTSTTVTACGQLPANQGPPECGGTTTTSGPCTTTTPGGCTAGCQFYCDPIIAAWKQLTSGCTPACPCSAPTSACNASTNQCATVTQPCVVPFPSCTGGCGYSWTGSSWVQVSNTCAGTNVPNCTCDAPPPSVVGTYCGQKTSTGCYVHGSGGGGGCYTSTTTTNGPGCGGVCTWGSSTGSAWDTILGGCPGCSCTTPTGTPANSCSETQSPCGPPGSTTTTTTTASPDPCRLFCSYSCGAGNSYVLFGSLCPVSGGLAACHCPDPSAVTAAQGPCLGGSGYFTTMTCLPGTSTTTTTKTTAG